METEKRNSGKVVDMNSFEYMDFDINEEDWFRKMFNTLTLRNIQLAEMTRENERLKNKQRILDRTTEIMVDIPAACQITGYSRSTIYKYIYLGVLEPQQGRPYRFKLSYLLGLDKNRIWKQIRYGV